MKAIAGGMPKRLSENLKMNISTERRNPRFRRKAYLCIGHQAVENQTSSLLNDLALTGLMASAMTLSEDSSKCTIKWLSEMRRWFFPLG